MASEDETKSSLPPYPELILEAIKALDEKDGSNKTAISKHIESQHAELPAGHATLLAHHLSKMKSNGELVLVNENYKLPDPNTPAKRGRGRPPKPKTPVPEGTPQSSPRPRGRPPKSKDPETEPASAAKSASGTPKRGRGRPPKGASPASAKSKAKKPKTASPASASPAVSGAKRGRGRPPKAKPEAAATAVGSD